MTKLEFVNTFFEEFKNNGFSNIARGMCDANFINYLPDMISKVETKTINNYVVEQFSYEKITKRVKETETTPEIPRVVEIITSENKFKITINDNFKMFIFVLGENENDFKLIGKI